ncbi:restriction endonuclease subunit S [Halomonas alimentaria]|uniref:Restriction endonuclease subunit S n=1 Tax=Halomonas alimentaria TaxID=147248 RepID=A0A7X5APN3_9GAMM|nr:restriction endonuclease subunit S [Halomonas alimentaria]NAW35345.1 restriction endonuclease subunit S [Halomonas alimentaria]
MTHLTATLDEVCEFIVDCLHATAPTQETGYPLIRTPNIGKGRLSLEKAYRVSDETYQKWTRRAVPEPGDLILAREAPAGNIALVQPGQEVCLGQRTVHLRLDKKKVDPAFLCYYLLSPSQQAALLAGETGATAKHVNMKDIRRLPLVNLPHLDVQVKVGEMLAGYDDLIENNQRRIQLLEESARLLYKEWFVHLRFPGHEHVKVTNGVPEGWEPLPLGDLITLQRGFDLPVSKRVEGEVPIYASTGITGYHAEAKVSGPGVVTGRSGSLGHVMYVSDDYWPLNTTLWIKDFKKIKPHFARHLLANLHLEQYNGGAAVPTLNRNDVHRIQALFPPSMLLSLFEEQALDLYRQVDVLTKTNERLAKARDLLLPKLMSGELAA